MHRIRTSGNALIFTLIIGLGLMAIVSVLLATTRANVQTADERTARAQLSADTTIAGPVQFARVLKDIPAALQTYSPETALENLSECPRIKVFVGTRAACGEANPDPRPITNNVRAGSLPQLSGTQGQTTEIPLTLSYTATTSDNRKRTLLMHGQAVRNRFESSTVSNLSNSSSFAILADQITIPDEARVFDGQVYIRDIPTLPARKDIVFGQGLITHASQIRIGSQTTAQEDFAPNPVYPCDQSESTCPQFSGGLGMAMPDLDAKRIVEEVASNYSAPVFNIPADTDTIYLGTQGSVSLMFMCNPVDCKLLRFKFPMMGMESLGSSLHYESLGQRVPRPPNDGSYYALPDNLTVQSAGTYMPLFKGQGNLTVRALQPNAPAFNQAITIYTPDNINVVGNILAQNPPCDTYPVSNPDGSVIPANCAGAVSYELLELVAGGNLYIGDPLRPLSSGETQNTINAHLSAGGTLRVADQRLQNTLIVGSLSAGHVDLTKLQLTEDPRMLRIHNVYLSNKASYRLSMQMPETQD